ncbi:MAG: hypothetical protein AAF944_00465 [Bacteroidota bacterium]
MKEKYLLIILTIFIGCTESNDYHHVLYSDENVIAQGSISKYLENGEFKITSGQKLLQKGKFINGQKIGLWQYYSDDHAFEVDWQIYDRDDQSLSIIFPTIWELIEREETLFLTDVTPDDKSDNRIFVVLEHDLGDESTSLEEAAGVYYFSVSENYKLLEKTAFLIDSRFCFLAFEGEKDGEVYLIYTFLFFESNALIEITLTHSYGNIPFKEMMFFDILYGTFINGERLVSPLKEPQITSVNLED